MPVNIDLREFFTPEAVAQVLKTLPPLKTPVVDTIFPDSKRRQHGLPVVGVDEIVKTTNAVPVVRRGSPSVPIGDEGRTITYIEPQPIDVNSFFTAKDLNDLKLLDKAGRQQVVTNRIDDMRRVVRATTEGLASQALTGQIAWPMKTEGGVLDTYQVGFGSPLTYSPDLTWDDANKKAKDILNDLIQMESQVQDESGYAEMKIWAGRQAFLALAGVVENISNKSAIKVSISERAINLAGYSVELMNVSYYDPATKTRKKIVDEKKVVMWANDAPFTLLYCAIDDMKAGLLPMPFYARPVDEDDPSGVKILGKSKPLPVPVPKAICWATVVS